MLGRSLKKLTPKQLGDEDEVDEDVRAEADRVVVGGADNDVVKVRGLRASTYVSLPSPYDIYLVWLGTLCASARCWSIETMRFPPLFRVEYFAEEVLFDGVGACRHI